MESITAEDGSLLDRLSYDPHGKRRLADWQAGTPASPDAETPRGFTGHEHLDGVELIHMNGRVYDPTLGRFLSADPYVFDPVSTQGYNRYAYVYNNPLSYTDPSGFQVRTPGAAINDMEQSGEITRIHFWRSGPNNAWQNPDNARPGRPWSSYHPSIGVYNFISPTSNILNITGGGANSGYAFFGSPNGGNSANILAINEPAELNQCTGDCATSPSYAASAGTALPVTAPALNDAGIDPNGTLGYGADLGWEGFAGMGEGIVQSTLDTVWYAGLGAALYFNYRNNRADPAMTDSLLSLFALGTPQVFGEADGARAEGRAIAPIAGAMGGGLASGIAVAARSMLKAGANAVGRFFGRVFNGGGTTGRSVVPYASLPKGDWGEARLAHYVDFAGIVPTKPIKTSLGLRKFDRIVDDVAHESKAGVNVGLKTEIEKQILKDAELLRQGRFAEIHWHFWQGAQDDVLKLLEQHGIKYTVH